MQSITTRLIMLSVVLWLIMTLPVSIVHELGHAIACQSAGHTATFSFALNGFATNCQPDLFTMAFYVSGPIVGSTIALGITAIGFTLSRHQVSKFAFIGILLIIVGIAQSADQVSKIYLEGYARDVYESNSPLLNLADGAFQIAALAIPLAIYIRKVSKDPKLVEAGIVLDSLILACIRNPRTAADIIRTEFAQLKTKNQ